MAGLLDSIGTSVKNTIGSVLGKSQGGASLARLFGAGLNKGAESGIRGSAEARWSSRTTDTDWRVKLTLAPESPLVSMFFGSDSRILEPLSKGGTNGIIFPLTPSVIVQQSAHYQPMSMTHSNQPHYAYSNSEVSSYTVLGEFPVQNAEDAKHWVATLHFLRSVSKMFFGGSDGPQDFKGNPPPVLQLNGYGNYVFKNVPVVLTNFTVELTQGVDYICTSQGGSSTEDIDEGVTNYGASSTSVPETWAPTMSIFTLQLQPVYSRDTMKQFSMSKFVKGELSPNSEGIGMI